MTLGAGTFCRDDALHRTPEELFASSRSFDAKALARLTDNTQRTNNALLHVAVMAMPMRDARVMPGMPVVGDGMGAGRSS